MNWKIILPSVICLVLLIGCTSQNDTQLNSMNKGNEVTENNSKYAVSAETDNNQLSETNSQVEEAEEINGEERNESELTIYGTWRLDEIVLQSEEYDNVSPDKMTWYGNEEEFIGMEIEYTESFMRLGDEVFPSPQYSTSSVSFNEYKSGGDFRQPHPYEVIEVEDINISNREKYDDLSDVQLVEYKLDFEANYSIPYGTYVVVLNDDTLFLGGWGKVILARRVK